MTHIVDEHVGKRLRELRKYIGLSQSKVAEGLGLTFQQVQKYERGANRISASKLYDAARLLGVSIESFYLGLEVSEGDSPDADVLALVATDADVSKLVRLFQLTPVSARRQILDLVEVLATGESGPAIPTRQRAKVRDAV